MKLSFYHYKDKKRVGINRLGITNYTIWICLQRATSSLNISLCKRLIFLFFFPLEKVSFALSSGTVLSHDLNRVCFNFQRSLKKNLIINSTPGAVCPRSLDQFPVVACYIKWVKTSWTYRSRSRMNIILKCNREIDTAVVFIN